MIFLFICFISSAQKLEGQFLIDSILIEIPKLKPDSSKVKLLNELSFTYQNVDPKLGLAYSKQALILSKKINWNDGIAEAYRVTAVNLSVTSNYKNALNNCFTALTFTKNKKIISNIYRNIGLIHTYQNNFPLALKYGNLSLKLCEELDDYQGQAAVLSNIGIIYFDLNQFEKAIIFYEKARKINSKLKNFTYLVNNLGNLGHCYTALKDYDKGLKLYNESIEIAKLQNNKYSVATNLGAIGQLYFTLNQFENVLKYTYQALKINEELGNENSIAFNLGVIGDTYLEKAKIESNKNLKNEYLKKAFENLNKTLQLKKKLGVIKEIAADYSQISIAQELSGDFKSALISERFSKIYKDSVFNEENKETIKNIQDKREIELRDKEIKINLISLQSKEKQKWFLLSGMLLLAIIGSLLFYQNKNREKTNKKLQSLNTNLDQANKTKIKLLSILNHDLRSPVNSFIHYIQFQKENPNVLDAETKSRIENESLLSAKNLLQSMEDILLWSKDQMENFNPVLKNTSVETVFEDTKKHFSAEKNTTLLFENPENITLVTDENFLKTIIRNLTANAIKASNYSAIQPKKNNLEITWKSWQIDNKIYLSITDNGLGANLSTFNNLFIENSNENNKSGLGFHLIRDLAKAINCEVSVSSKISEGTTIILKL